MATHAHGLLGAVAGVLLLTATPLIPAQQDRPIILSDEPGQWKPWTFSGFSSGDLRSVGATAADAKTFETRLKQLADILRASPVWSPPVGVDALLSGSGSVPVMPRTHPPSYQPLSGDILMGSFEHLAKDKDRRERFVGGETNLVEIGVNRLPRGGGGGISLEDEEGPFMKAHVRTGEMAGFPVYGGDVLVITTNGRQPWTSVSRERYLKALVAKRRVGAKTADTYIAEQQKQLDAFITPEATAARQKEYAEAIAKVESKGAAAVEHERRYWERDEADSLAALQRAASRDPKVSRQAATIAGIKVADDELAGMSAAELGEQACFVASDDPIKTGLVPIGTGGCVPLVCENRRFFDPQLPRGVPQIITVSRLADVEKGWKAGRPVAGTSGPGQIDLWTTYEVLRRTDWQKMAELLGK